MRLYNPDAQEIRERRGALKETPMVWIEAHDREDGSVAPIGLWRGEDAETITVPDIFTGVSQERVFYTGLMDIGNIQYAAGLTFDPVNLRMSSIHPAVIIAFRQYEARGAKVQIWRRCYDPLTALPVAIEPVFKGFIDECTITRPEPGGEAALTARAVSTARLLTITSGRKKSHEAQKKRNGDSFRRHKASAGSWDIAWGVED